MSSLLNEPGVLVTGASGQVGTAFRSLLPEATYLTRSELDLLDTASISERVLPFRPTAIINCAAYTAVDRAEEEPDSAMAVNGDAVGELARIAADLAIPFVTYSSDYVFDGTATAPYVESSPVGPINVYGRSKLAGERLALSAYPSALIIRTSWVISGSHDNFVATMLRLAGEGRALDVVDDQTGRPTIAADLARGTLAAVASGAAGLLHMANQGTTTWFELARESIAEAGLDPDLISPCTTERFPRPAPRPMYSVLASEVAATAGIEPLPDWRVGLPDLVAQQRARLALS